MRFCKLSIGWNSAVWCGKHEGYTLGQDSAPRMHARPSIVTQRVGDSKVVTCMRIVRGQFAARKSLREKGPLITPLDHVVALFVMRI